VSASIPPHSAWLEFPSGERQFLTESTISIGRAPSNRVIIASDRVSRNHAAIRREEDGTFSLIDFGSSNGTFLNGQRVGRPVVLRNGWVIEIGLQKMTFRTPPAVAAQGVCEDEKTVSCWLLTLSASMIGCRAPGGELGDKTFESWSERAQRIVAKYRGRIMRGRDEGLLAYWPVTGADSRAGSVVASIRSLTNIQRDDEEFRISLHHGLVTLKASPTGEEAPYGSDIIGALQLDRFASSLRIPILLTEAASCALEGTVTTRRLSAEELRDFRGEQKFYTLETI